VDALRASVIRRSNVVLTDAGIWTVRTRVWMPRMNAVMERGLQTRRRELLDCALLWNQQHLLHALREFETSCNEHRPHQRIANSGPLKPPPPPIIDSDEIVYLNVRRSQRLGGIPDDVKMPLDLYG
jgi:hypothetical protein